MGVETENLVSIIKGRHMAGKPVGRDVATHALLLVGNGWKAQEALDESQRTLDDAEIEGAY